MKKILFLLLFVIYASPISANATFDEGYDEDISYGNAKAEEYDPLEPINRAIFEFNNVVDGVLLDPLASGYNQAIPTWVKKRITNVVYNLSEPVTVLNSALQGDDINAFTSFWRFIINTTFGLLGTYDAATEVGLKARSEGFGQTLAVWGLDNSPYIVVPVLGPSTIGNSIGGYVDHVSNPFNHSEVFDADSVIAHKVAAGIDAKAKTVRITTEIKETALDPYAALRTMYLQNFRNNVKNGK